MPTHLPPISTQHTESIRRLIELGNQLTKGLTNVMDHQSYMRQREDLHAASTCIFGPVICALPIDKISTTLCGWTDRNNVRIFIIKYHHSYGEHQLARAHLDGGGGAGARRGRLLAGTSRNQSNRIDRTDASIDLISSLFTQSRSSISPSFSRRSA